MAAKDLSRTVIEGGRCATNQIDRRLSMRSLRANTRAYLSTARRDPEAADGAAAPVRERVRRTFDDKLNPAYRFLDSRVGKGWNNTIALLAERFDLRTIPGRHVVHDHILREVAPSKEAIGTSRRGPKPYYVDPQGILRKAPRHRRRHERRVVFDREMVLAWLEGRQVGRVGSRLFWFVAARDASLIRMIARPNRLAVEYALEGARPDDPAPAFRQSRPLAKSDVEFFERLDERVRNGILSCAPTVARRNSGKSPTRTSASPLRAAIV